MDNRWGHFHKVRMLVACVGIASLCSVFLEAGNAGAVPSGWSVTPSPNAGHGDEPRSNAGPTWVIEKTPQVVEESSLENGVSCTSSTLCIGVGSYLNPVGLEEPLTGEWKGGSWSYQSLGIPGFIENVPDDAEFTGVSCVSPKACLAVGWMDYANKQGIHPGSRVEWIGLEISASCRTWFGYYPLRPVFGVLRCQVVLHSSWVVPKQ